MNYMTGQAMSYLVATIVFVAMFSILLTMIWGGEDSDNKYAESISQVAGKNLHRNGGE